MSIRQHIPNTITSANLFLGCVGLYFAFTGRLDYAAWMIALAAICDFLDGFVARILHVKSELGVQLDSLADVVSFGVLPGVILFEMMCGVLPAGIPFVITFLAFLIPVFSAVRLAKFNIDTRQTDYFIGLPTPANALFIASFPLISTQVAATNWSFITQILQNYWILSAIVLLQSYLLVAEIPLFSLKFKNFTWKDNAIRFLFLGIAAILLIVFQYVAVPLIILLYVLMSVFCKP